jgi:hypothetical protein
MSIARVLNLGAIVFFLLTCLAYGQYALGMLLPAGDGFANHTGKIAGGDFLVFYNTAVMTVDGAATSVWDHAVFEANLTEIFGQEIGLLHFFNPPVGLLLWWPFGHLPYFSALWLWTLLPAVGFAWCLHRLTNSWFTTVLCTMAPLMTYNAGAGQTGAFFAMLLAFFVLHLDRRPALAGSAGAMFVIKPHLAIALPFCLVIEGRWGALFAMAGVAAGLFLLSVGLFGTDAWLAFVNGIQHHSGEIFAKGTPLFDRSPSLLLGSLQIGLPAAGAWSIQVTGSLLALIMGLYVLRNSDDHLHRLFALTLTICLLTPKIMHYDLPILLIPIAIVIARLEAGKADPPLVIVSMVIWVLPFLEPFYRQAGYHPGGLVFFLALMAIFVRVLRLPDRPHETVVEAA